MTATKNLPRHIKKGHQLVFSQQDLTAREADLFGVMIANMKPSDWDFGVPEYSFAAHELSDWLGISNRATGSQIKSIVSRLSSRKIGIVSEKDGDTEFEFTPLFKKAIYKNRVLTLIPNDALMKEYIEYNKGFSLINTKSYLGLKREYSKRLYEMLSRFKTDGKTLKTIEIEDLKAYMGMLTEDGKFKSNRTSFQNTSVLLRRCIKDSIEELNKDPMIRKELIFYEGKDGLGIKLYKHGRNIHSIEFLYSWVDDSNPIEKLNFEDAKRKITKLETKRLTTDEPLSNEELELLVWAYRSIDEEERAAEVQQALINRSQSDTLIEEIEEEQDKSFLDKLLELQNLNSDKAY